MANENVRRDGTAVVAVERKALAIGNKATEWLKDCMNKNFVTVPAGYDVGSEVSLAMLKLAETKDKNGNCALDICTEASILTQMKLMVANGVSMGKNQCYPIVRGGQLQIMRSYFGTEAVLKRLFPNCIITTNVLHEGDEYDYYRDPETDCDRVENVKTKLENRDKPIIGAYGCIRNKNNNKVMYSEVMTWAEIQTCWKHAQTDKVQKEFPQEMAKRTLINRMCKRYINSSNHIDASTVEAYNQMESQEYDEKEFVAPTTDKDKAIRQKSRGNEGLSAILNAEAEDAVVREPEPEVKEEVAPEAEAPAEPEAKPEEAPTVKVPVEIDDAELPF